MLGDTFDADSKVSVLAKIEALVFTTMKGLITPEIADSPIGRLKTELVDTVQREVSDVAEELRRVTEHLGISDATADVYEHTTGKGFDYEDIVDECVSTFAAGYGDLAENTGQAVGLDRVAGGRRGRHAQSGRHARHRGPVHARDEEPSVEHAQDDGRARRSAGQP